MKHILSLNIRISILAFLSFFQLTIKSQISKEPEFYEDSSSYDVNFYHLSLEVSNSSIHISGNTSIKARATNTDLTNFYIELSDSLIVDSLCINNAKQYFFHKNGWLKSTLTSPVKKDGLFNAKVYYHGYASQRGVFGGIRVDSVGASSVLSVLAEPFDSYTFFPCKQYLTDKADSVYIYLTVPEGLVAASNGLLKEKLVLPDRRIIFKWETHYPIAYYLIAFAVSDYREYTYKFYDNNYNDSILFQNFIYHDPSYLFSVKSNIDMTVEIIKFYEQLIQVPFPFRNEKYGHVTAPIGGGMENQTLTMLTSFDVELVAHELAHSWFGDLVTCADWQNIFVNESFATYMEYLEIEHYNPTFALTWLKTSLSNVLKSPEGSVFVPDELKWNELRIFNYRLTYIKGALVLHMLRKKINNNQVYFNIYKKFLEKYSFKNATAEDFRKIAEQETGLELNEYFQQWYYGKGFPVIRVEWKSNHDSLYFTTHYLGSSSSNPIFNFDLEVLTHYGKGKDSLIQIAIKDTIQKDGFKLGLPVDSIEVNPYVNLIADISVTHIIPEITAFSVSPNPFKDSTVVYFQKKSFNRTIELFDLKGCKIGIWSNVDSTFNIDSKILNPGIYILRASDNYGSYTRKIVRN
jgi:aminopeptidase N